MLRPRLFLLVLVSFLYGGLIAQESSSFTFNSELEEVTFTQLKLKAELNDIQLLSCIDPEVKETSELQERIDELLAKIDVSKYSKNKRQKLIKLVYESVHNEFLRKYKEENYFSDISKYGNYNCVSATGLYAVIFERLSIPYAIKETPTHVFLVVYPDEDQIVVETTSPTFGYIEMNDDFKKEYINYLVENKVVSESELRNSNIKDLFNEYYFTETDISFLELVGIQYLNDAIYKSIEENYKEAFNQLLKAKNFYEGEKIDFLLLSVAHQWLASEELEADERFKVVSFIWQSDNETFSDELVLYEFHKALEEVLIEKGNYEKADSLYKSSLLLFGKNEFLQKEIKFSYNFERGRLYYNLGKGLEALKLIKIAIQEKPEHVDAKSLLAYTFVRVYNSVRFSEIKLDSLENNFDVYPFLKENNNYRSFFLEYCLMGAYQSFLKDDQKEGMELLGRFERHYSDDIKSNLNLEKAGWTYIEASKYYFRIRNMKELRRVLEKALEFDPENEEAQRRLDSYF